MNAHKILMELCQRLRFLQQQAELPEPPPLAHEHKRIAELLDLGKDDADVQMVKRHLDEDNGEAALKYAVAVMKLRRDKPDFWTATKTATLTAEAEKPSTDKADKGG